MISVSRYFSSPHPPLACTITLELHSYTNHPPSLPHGTSTTMSLYPLHTPSSSVSVLLPQSRTGYIIPATGHCYNQHVHLRYRSYPLWRTAGFPCITRWRYFITPCIHDHRYSSALTYSHAPSPCHDASEHDCRPDWNLRGHVYSLSAFRNITGHNASLLFSPS